MVRTESNNSLLSVKNYQKRAFNGTVVKKPAEKILSKYFSTNQVIDEVPRYMQPLKRNLKNSEENSQEPQRNFIQKTRSSVDLSKFKKAKYINQGPIGLSAKIKMLKSNPSAFE
jgi:hypothetical protein